MGYGSVASSLPHATEESEPSRRRQAGHARSATATAAALALIALGAFVAARRGGGGGRVTTHVATGADLRAARAGDIPVDLRVPTPAPTAADDGDDDDDASASSSDGNSTTEGGGGNSSSAGYADTMSPTAAPNVLLYKRTHATADAMADALFLERFFGMNVTVNMTVERGSGDAGNREVCASGRERCRPSSAPPLPPPDGSVEQRACAERPKFIKAECGAPETTIQTTTSESSA